MRRNQNNKLFLCCVDEKKILFKYVDNLIQNQNKNVLNYFIVKPFIENSIFYSISFGSFVFSIFARHTIFNKKKRTTKI